jgi:hypothetical protein
MRLTNPQSLSAYWGEHYAITPLAHLLRKNGGERWFRIHALPDGKRYPETPAEYATVLDRHNALLSHVLTDVAGVVAITARYSFDRKPVRDPAAAHPDDWYWATVPAFPGGKDSSWCHLYARNMTWRTGLLDPLLRLVAEDRVGNFMVLGPAERVLYLPYDGGADVIAADREQRDALKDQFRDWLSPLASGL